MVSAIKRIGVLTSGGDAPGMNATIRAVVRTAQCHNIDCIGVYRGYSGLLRGDFKQLKELDVKGITGLGGTMLFTARSEEFATPEGKKKAAERCKHAGIEGLVIIGGDGSLTGARDLAKEGVKIVGIPCTIDNDIGCTSYSIGFDTACNTAVEAVDRLNDTMRAHERCAVVEVMGRRAGYIALSVGIAVGATITLVPEVKIDFEENVIERIRLAKFAGRRSFTVVVAEGNEPAHIVAEKIYEATGLETRVTTLGHIQRGGSPLVRDRVIATKMGYRAVELLAEGKTGRVIAMDGDDCVDYEINEALSMTKKFDYEAYKMFNQLTFLDRRG
jgi:6-phosphofructokinase 1